MPANLVAELAGSQCRCGRVKRRGETFCKRCYYMLPDRLRSPLYRMIGDGYNEAYAEAVAYLRRAYRGEVE